MAMNYGRAGGALDESATQEKPTLPRDYTALEERALLAFLDRREEERCDVLRAAREIVSDVLETEEFEIEEMQGNDKVIVTVDGMKFRVTTGVRTPQLDKSSNASIQGIHDEQYTSLAVFLRGSWFPVASLADLGALIK